MIPIAIRAGFWVAEEKRTGRVNFVFAGSCIFPTYCFLVCLIMYARHFPT